MFSHLASIARFALVGTIGFLVDSATLYCGLFLGLGLLSGRVFSFLVAATVCWWLHRRITFRLTSAASLHEWLRYMSANALGAAINIGGYAALVFSSEVFRHHPVLAVGIGALGGMVINYLLSAFVVFRGRTTPSARAAPRGAG